MPRRSTRRVGEPGDMGDMTVTVDALKETAPGETRVAVTPASVQRLRASEIDVLVERDAGAGALLPARTYTDVGARVDDRDSAIVNVPMQCSTNQLLKYSHMALAWRNVLTSGNSCGPGGSMRQSSIRSMNGIRQAKTPP